jgi:pyruvate/2-oxoglutarate dehydrogenase complex dihydrolipoamide dehydrogenase (E3) component/uncharacterized membrane protein YdjX (TVP38/TMEM64 family)
VNRIKLVIAAFILLAVGAYVAFDLGQYLTLGFIQSRLASLQAFRDENFAVTAAIYFVFYVVATGISIPGAILLTLLGGAIFGLWWGTLLVSFASSIGATGAFLASRLLLRDWVQRRFGAYLAPINKGIAKDGAFYLFSLRMVPLVPFFVVNLLMGLTSISVPAYYFASQIGMFVSTLVYVNAGAELAQITSLSGLVSPSVLVSFTLLGVVPLAAKGVIGVMQKRKRLSSFKKPKRFDTNVVVVGGGSAGLVTSLIVAGAKAKVVLVEKHRMGGDCLYTGCVPSKSIIRSGRIMEYIRRAEDYGIVDAAGKVDFAAVMRRVQTVIETIEPHDSPERFTSLGVECVSGAARLLSPYEVEVEGKRITTESIVIASGARPFIPSVPGLDGIDYLTSDNVWSLTELPPRLLVVGGGPIGCELAQAFSRLGSKVTQVDMAERIMPREDADVSAAVSTRFEAQGIEVLTSHRLQKFETVDGEHFMEAEHQGKTVRVAFDRVLLAIGRKANTEGFGLEEIGVALTPQGTVEVNEYLQTSLPNVFACGDVAGPYQFTHMASYQAWFAALNAIAGGIWRSRVNYSVVPWATFTDPEVARVGLSEDEAKQRGIAYELTRYEMNHHDRSLADGEAHGFVKILTVPGKDKILGVTIVGYHAGEQIAEFVFAMTHNMGLKSISAVTHIYPTLGEANKFAANAWRSARLPTQYLPWLKRFFDWRRG